MRSKLFRTLFIEGLDNFLSLGIGFRRNAPLPPPTKIASILRSKSLELLEKWHESFGVHYRQLRLSLDYLKNTLRYQFPDRLGNAMHLQEERRARDIRSKEILQKKYENLQENFSSIKAEILSTLDQLEECHGLILKREDAEVDISSFSGEDEPEEFSCPELLRIRQESLKEGEKVYENDENTPLFDALREFYKLLLSKHLPLVQEAISVLIRIDLPDNRFRDSVLKEFIDVQNMIQTAKKKCEELGCVLPSSTQEKEEENMWEEGKIEIYDQANAGDSSEKLAPLDSFDHPVDPGPSANEAAPKIYPGGADSGSLKSKLLVEAPVLKWGPFLESWGSTQDAMVNYRGLELESHWGRVDQDAIIPRERITELSSHWSLYQESSIEIRPCLAPLKKGGLCQRRDLSVCPFHGPIIPRDPNGDPVLQQPANRKDPEVVCSQEDLDLTDEELRNSSNQQVRDLAFKAIRNVREVDRKSKSLKRAKLAKVLKHNEAVLKEAALSSTICGPSSEQPPLKSKKPSLSSMLKKKVTSKDRLAQRLLKSRVTESASKQIMQAEEICLREAYPNQW